MRDVIGRCEAGEVLAIVGGSGSGKTTLLNSIGGRLGASLPILEGDVVFTPAGEGEVRVDGAAGEEKAGGAVGRVGGKEVGRVLGFVRQHDFLLPHLTVRETLSFAAALRLPRSVGEEERTAIVQQTIEGGSFSLSSFVASLLYVTCRSLTETCSRWLIRTRSEGRSRHHRRWSSSERNLWRRTSSTLHRLCSRHSSLCFDPRRVSPSSLF